MTIQNKHAIVYVFQNGIERGMGQGTSKTSQEIFQGLPDTERYFGFENFGNTCYCNSVLQALYFCKIFRDRVVTYGTETRGKADSKETVLSCLSELFTTVRGI